MLPDKLGIGTKIKCLKPNNTNSLIKKTEPRMCFSNIFRSYRSRHLKMFLWKGVLKICSKCVGEHTCRSANTWRAASEVKNFPSYLINRFYENILISQYRHSQPGIFCIHFESFMRILTSCCCGYHYCTTSFKQILNSGSGHGQTGDSRRWGSLTTVPAGNKAKRLSLVNHTTKAVHHHHHQSFLLYFYIV